jgi:hypothetical protein
MLGVMQEVNKMPFHILADLLGHEYEFGLHGHPAEIESDDAPPKRIDNKREWWPIDEVLGKYDPIARSITLYRIGIEAVGSRLDRPTEHIRKIVRLHEFAHALFHIGLTEKERLEGLRNPTVPIPNLDEKTGVFLSVETPVHENLVQLATFHALRRMAETANHVEARQILQETLDTFWALNQIQPPEYRIETYKDVPVRRVVKGFGLLKNARIKGDWNTWNTVLTW